MRAVPYKGDAPMMADVMGRTMPVAITGIPSVVSLVKSGQLRALATTGSSRLKLFPGTPTIAETYPGLVISSWLTLFAPAGTPPAVIQKLANAVRQVMADPSVVEQVETSGSRPEVVGPQEFRKFLEADIKEYADTIKAANIKLE